ncbi:hypothetical protein BDA99DRAFT_515449 [Phascolomyces articulosus]|uniref:Uncharacterized protein n=1 Tax=Phascolomyces articulosus TaxID=60185 RepID=A0AAD5PE17_9FUNG|nr:hypothetical protein BDA99DRAFT_515449 [Phascolomyces articulosus]
MSPKEKMCGVIQVVITIISSPCPFGGICVTSRQLRNGYRQFLMRFCFDVVMFTFVYISSS